VVSNANHGDLLAWKQKGVSCCASSLTFSLPLLAPSYEAVEFVLAVQGVRQPFGAKQPNGQKSGRSYSLAYPQNTMPGNGREPNIGS
jgi:hypothetical protein